MRYRAVVEYDGTAYCGFQKQRESPTIQQELEQAIQSVSERSIKIVGAGRTDSGVHALGQVIAFDLNWNHKPDALQRAINANLPADIVINELSEASEQFHPRFDALSRVYEYYIYNQPLRSPLRRLKNWQIAQPLDMKRMNEAAAVIVGENDFATFGQPPQGKNTVRMVYRAVWRRKKELLIFKIEANAFLYRMVRSLVGSMKAVGEGSWTVEEFAKSFMACDRSRAGQTAPAHALFLLSVKYEKRL